MKQFLLGSLFSCMLVGQTFSAADGTQEHRLPSMLQLCINAYVDENMEPNEEYEPTFMDSIRSVLARNNAERLGLILPAHVTQDAEYEACMRGALSRWHGASEKMVFVAGIPAAIVGLCSSVYTTHALYELLNQVDIWLSEFQDYVPMSFSAKRRICGGIVSLAVMYMLYLARSEIKNFENIPLKKQFIILSTVAFAFISTLFVLP